MQRGLRAAEHDTGRRIGPQPHGGPQNRLRKLRAVPRLLLRAVDAVGKKGGREHHRPSVVSNRVRRSVRKRAAG